MAVHLHRVDATFVRREAHENLIDDDVALGHVAVMEPAEPGGEPAGLRLGREDARYDLAGPPPADLDHGDSAAAGRGRERGDRSFFGAIIVHTGAILPPQPQPLKSLRAAPAAKMTLDYGAHGQ